MGILNVTPDSFSDGGRHVGADAATKRALAMVDEGADVIDIGGESTRPGAEPVQPDEEQRRVLPVMEALMAVGIEIPISVDTRHAETAAAALAAGAQIINDVSGLKDPAMVEAARNGRAGLVIMHMQGEPGTMQEAPSYDDVAEEVFTWLNERALLVEAAGILPDSVIVDPGLGFGKRTGGGVEDNCRLLDRLPELVSHGRPVLVGASRKRFIGNLTGAGVGQRLPGSLAAALAATWAGAAILRVHDVAETVQAVRLASRLDPADWATAWHAR